MATVAAALVLWACVSPAERDAEHVLASIERLRSSEQGERETHLAALEVLRTEVPAAELARAACAAAYRSLENAHKLITAASAHPDAAKLASAQAELKTARLKREECTANTSELRRWLKKN